MRKLLILLTALVLLCGCTEEKPVETEQTIPPETAAVEYYVEDSAVETKTGGTVRQYALPEDVLWIKSAGTSLLLGTESGVQLMEGKTGLVVASTRMDASYPDNWSVLDNGFSFYDPQTNCIVLMDDLLNAKTEIPLTEEMATPVISLDGKLIYYCVGQEIRAYEVEHRVSRLLKSHSYTNPKLVGTCFDDKILSCNVVDTEGVELTVYIATDNGQTLSADTGIQELYSGNDRYLVERKDGSVLQQIVGSLEGQGSLLTVPDDYVAGALEMNSVVGYGIDETGALSLNLYNVDTGLWTASITLENYGLPNGILADEDSDHIWLLTGTSDGESECLLRWEPTELPKSETSYLGKIYTAQDPDKVGLKKLEERVTRLNDKYGVRIRIWEEAVQIAEGHILKPEHQVSAIEQTLDELELVFQEFPPKFLYNSISSRVRICIVRSVDSEAKGTQFWSDKYAFVVLSPGTDIRSEFLKAFGMVVDSHILGNSPLFDYWNALNPEGFTYGTLNDELASGDNRAFVDEESMKSVVTDRSRVFWQAMQPDNESMFTSETMQKKLELMCRAIRDAWKLEKKTDIYPWEQYLTEPIAPKKK